MTAVTDLSPAVRQHEFSIVYEKSGRRSDVAVAGAELGAPGGGYGGCRIASSLLPSDAPADLASGDLHVRGWTLLRVVGSHDDSAGSFSSASA